MEKDHEVDKSIELSRKKSEKLNDILAKLDNESFRKRFAEDPNQVAKDERISISDINYLPAAKVFVDIDLGILTCSGCGCACLPSAGKGVGCGDYGGSWS